MSSKFDINDGVLSLGEDVDVNQVAELYQELKHEAGSGSSNITLDSTAITRIDGASMQLLAAFSKAYSDAGGKLDWGKPSPEFLRIGEVLGLSEALGLTRAQ
ncbi:MAG: STAS domain-containing protein [bacterium]